MDKKKGQKIISSYLIIFAFIWWKHVPNFIDGQGLEFKSKVQWNTCIAKTIVQEKNSTTTY